MSSPFVCLGPSARVTINGVNFGVVDGRFREVADEADCTDTENEGFKFPKGGLLQLEVEVTAHQATDVSPHAAPLNLKPKELIAFEMFPDKEVEDQKYICDNMLVLSFETNVQVQGSQPQTVRISMKSQGPYSRPGET